MTDSKRVLLGRIANAHGIRGEVTIHSYTEFPDSIGAYGPLWDAAGKRTFEIVTAKTTAKGVIARIKGVDDRTAAEALKGVDLYVARAALPDDRDAGVYHADLVGMRAVSPDGTTIGTIVSVANYGASDILEIKRDGVVETELVAYVDDYVRAVDVEARRITLVMPTYLDDGGEKPG